MEVTKPFAVAPQVVPEKPEDNKDYNEEEKVAMVFPRNVSLTTDHHTILTFAKGVQAVPKSLVNHDWLKKHGVKPVDEKKIKGGRKAADIQKEISDLQVELEEAQQREEYQEGVDKARKPGEIVPTVPVAPAKEGEPELDDKTPVKSPEPDQLPTSKPDAVKVDTPAQHKKPEELTKEAKDEHKPETVLKPAKVLVPVEQHKGKK